MFITLYFRWMRSHSHSETEAAFYEIHLSYVTGSSLLYAVTEICQHDTEEGSALFFISAFL